MNLTYWLQQQLSGNDVPLDLPPNQQDLNGLTLIEAIEAHNAWIKKLDDLLHGKNPEEYDPAILGADHLCKVGKWLYGDGQSLSKHPEFEKLRTEHKKFHDTAGEILNLRADKKFAKALDLVRNDLPEASKKVKISLVSLMIAHNGDN